MKWKSQAQPQQVTVGQAALIIVLDHPPVILGHADRHMVTDPDHILDHQIDMTGETQIGTKTMMIDGQTIDPEVIKIDGHSESAKFQVSD